MKKAAVKRLKHELAEKLGGAVSELLKGAIEVAELDDGREVLLVNGKPLVFRTPEGFFPTLRAADQIKLKCATVDMGAVPHVAGGADVMAPGVARADAGIAPNDRIIIVDERHGKPLAVGIALVDSANMRAPKGRVIKNVHHVGDEIWRLGE